MHRPIALCLSLGFAIAGLPAQPDDEPGFLKRQAKALHQFATAAFKAGYPSMARPIWLEVLAEYDKDHAGSRKALGYVKFNTTWSPREGFAYPEGDNPSTSAAKNIKSKWAGVSRAVGQAHKKIASEFGTAGRSDRTNYHMARALRFLPDDAEVRAAMGHKDFGGMSGTDVEETLFQRSKQMDAAITRETKKEYPVEVLSSAAPAFFTAAGLSCTGVKSENFTIWGEWSEGVLKEGARYCERSMSFCREALVGSPRFGDERVRTRVFVFLKSKDRYQKMLRTTPALIGKAEHRAFVIKNGAATTFSDGGIAYRGFGPTDVPTLYDACVRFVASQYAGLRSDALNAGIGHAVVGRFFGQNRMFAIAQVTGTVTSNSRKLLLPDMDTWGELAVEAAFNPRGTKAAQLPLLKASKFPTDGRIKAWSFCDYLLRRDPKLLVALDDCRGERNPGSVNTAFDNKAGVALGKLEQGWKDFWTGASPVLAALRNRAPALHMVSKGGKRWLDGFNKARREARSQPTAWNASYSRNCQQHAEYLAKNRKARGPAQEHAQQNGAPGATRAGSVFASMALVVTKGSPARATKDWIHIPGYRDALLNPYLLSVGVYSEGPIAVLDVIRGMEFSGTIRNSVYPPANSKDRPNRIDAKILGPEVKQVLAERKIRSKTIGYPITVHGWRHGAIPKSIEAEVRQGGEVVEGFVLTGGRNRYSAAPGMAAFYPLEPLKSGVQVSVQFQHPGGKSVAKWSFTPK